MTQEHKIVTRAHDEKGWPFMFYIEKAQTAGDESEKMFIRGIASTTNVDHDMERMSPDCLKRMAEQINSSKLPLRNEHHDEWNSTLGTITGASVDSRNQLWIEAQLDKDNSLAVDLWKAIKEKNAQLGLSVMGRVRDAGMELNEAVGRKVKTFYDIVLEEVSVTKRPANYDAWLVAKGFKSPDASETPPEYYPAFLMEAPRLNYLHQLSKSIPAEAWVEYSEVDNLQDHNDMDKVTKAEGVTVSDTAGTPKTGTEKATVNPGTETTRTSDGTQTSDSTKTKAKAVGDKTESTETGTATGTATGSSPSTTEKSMEDQLTMLTKNMADLTTMFKAYMEKDSTRTTTTSEANGGTAKAAAGGTESTVTVSDTAGTPKATAKGTKDDTATGSTTDSTTKSQKDDGEKEFTIEDVPALVSAIERVAKARLPNGYRIPGLRSHITEEVMKSMGITQDKSTVKKSVAFMVAKEGSMTPLNVAKEGDSVAKANSEPQDFQSIYKRRFSGEAVGDIRIVK